MERTALEAINVPSCGLDVHKEMIEACVIDETGRKHRKTFDAMRKSLYALRDWVLSLNCMHVLMESTSVYWIPVYEVLEEVRGMDVGVGNAQRMKQVPGRPKTDKADSDWISRLCMMGLVLKSFVASRKTRELREYTRYHKKLVQERSRQVNRIEKLLQMNGFKLSSVLSDITGASGMKLLRILSEKGSVTAAEVQAELHRRVKRTPTEIESAINGQMKLTSRLLLGKMLSRLGTCDAEIADIYRMMSGAAEADRREIEQLESIPGIGEQSAIYILAEVSADMSSFKTSGHIAAWAGLAPKDNQSAGKLRYSKTQRANVYIRSVLIECAWAAVRARNTRLSNWYWSNVGRIGTKKAITAVARKLLVYVYAMLKSGMMYDDSLDMADTEKRKAYKLESACKIVERRSNAVNPQSRRIDAEQETFVPSLLRTHADTEAPESAVEPAPLIKRGRGRPRKVTNNEIPVPSPPKKRGRPRKTVETTNLATSQAI